MATTRVRKFGDGDKTACDPGVLGSMWWTFVALAAGAVVAVLINVVTRPEKGNTSGYVAGILVFLLIEAFALTRHGDGGPSVSESTQPVSSSSSSAGTDAQTSTQGSPSSEQTPTETPSIMATSLLDLPTVDQDTNSTIDLHSDGTTEIGGRTYGRALAYRCADFCNGSSPQTYLVTLGRQYAKFTATAAVLDTAAGRYRIDVTLDSTTPKTYYVEPGTSAPLSISVAGVYRMRIQLYAPGPLKNPLQAGADAAAGKNGGGGVKAS